VAGARRSAPIACRQLSIDDVWRRASAVDIPAAGLGRRGRSKVARRRARTRDDATFGRHRLPCPAAMGQLAMFARGGRGVGERTAAD